MSVTAADHADLDVREQIVRIDRAIAETEKFQAETRKLVSESLKTRRDRFLAPIALVIAGISVVASTVGPVVARALLVVHP